MFAIVQAHGGHKQKMSTDIMGHISTTGVEGKLKDKTTTLQHFFVAETHKV